LIDSASPSASDLTATLLARCTFPPAGTTVTCAVSGGADSMALLILARASDCNVTAVHVDHGLRDGSADEAGVVSAAAARFGAAFRPERVHVEPGPNLEARARAARFTALPPDVLTGHTADDQAETMLINLMRGAGVDGLSGMATYGHPILNLRRRETVALCAAYEVDVVHDPTNVDARFVRNRLRHEVLPLLADVAQRDVAAVLARQASLLRDDADLLDLLAADLDPTDAKALTAAPVALARRAVRRWLANPMPPTADEVDRVLAVARGEVIACEIEGGRRIARTAWTLRAESS
jgi:tRNA(Ile)-lysidine synthase